MHMIGHGMALDQFNPLLLAQLPDDPPDTASELPICNLRGTAALRRQGDRSGLTRAQRPSEAQSNKLCDPSMGEQNLLSKAASFRGQWLTRFWERMEKAPGGQAPLEFLSTHPSHG